MDRESVVMRRCGDRGPLKKFREETFTAYQTHWTNWQALVKHFEANNADIRLVTPQ